MSLALACLFSSKLAIAEPRIALIITNQAYAQDGMRLANAHRDGEVVKASLEKVGFQVWHVRDTASEGAMLLAVGEHVARLAKAGPDAVGFLYYSGHGAADRPGGADFLIPTAAPITHSAQLPLLAVRLERITAALGEAGRMNFVVFDACRNVPLQRDTKSLGFKGLARIPEQRGLLVAYAAEPGNVAVDQNLYSTALAEEMVKPGLEAGQVFRAVTRRVLGATQSRQTPEYLDKRLHDFHFTSAAPLPPAKPSVPQATSPPSGSSQFSFTGPPRPTNPTPKSDSHSTFMMDWDALLDPPEHKKPGSVFRDCPKCPEMVVVPAGHFTMGSPESEPKRMALLEQQIVVTIPRPFAVGKFAVTFDEWDGCVADGGCNGYKPSDQGWGRGKRPVINVSWFDAKAYATWLSMKSGKTYRLPTEAEREYFTRAGTTTPFWWGSSITPAQANYDYSAKPFKGSSKGEYLKKTLPVDNFKANPWGLYQVHGNVWEWTEDCWSENNALHPRDGSARTTGECIGRSIRGGSWLGAPQYLRSAARGGATPVKRLDNAGFRVVETLLP